MELEKEKRFMELHNELLLALEAQRQHQGREPGASVPCVFDNSPEERHSRLRANYLGIFGRGEGDRSLITGGFLRTGFRGDYEPLYEEYMKTLEDRF